MSVIPDLKTLYEIDDSLWLEETIELLKAKRFDALDLDNLIEELEDLGNEKKFRVASFLQQIIRHALLLQFWSKEKEYNQGHWKAEIVSFKDQLKLYLSTNLRKYLEQEFDNIYKYAVRYVRQKTENTVSFPDTCPYTLEELLDPNWLPSDNQGENNERNS
jgi:NTP pyrophosphatase (non-canonical NTP hydrolase)